MLRSDIAGMIGRNGSQVGPLVGSQPTGTQPVLQMAYAVGPQSNFTGRLALGMLGTTVLGLTVWYIATRKYQR